MYSKAVRRRRAVLALLVALSIILLTAYFGESAGGGLHSVQRGFMTVVSPIQDGANTVLKPVRDAVGWFGEMIKAKDERNRLRHELARLRAGVVAQRSGERTQREERQLGSLDARARLAGYRPVSASVVAQPAIVWYSTIDVDKGSSEGIQVNDPVIDGEGLVGKVTLVAPDSAQVSLITDSSVGVAARIAGSRQVGIVQPKVGNPSDLLLQYLPSNSNASPGELVETSGTIVGADESLFPAGIPIGVVTSVEEESPYRSVNLRPVVELHSLDTVQVLTAAPGSRPARLAAAVAGMPVGGQGGEGPETEEGAPSGGGYAQAEGG
jgi:rod shape-determining protein MreC